jgi:hypothetical protein
VTDLSQGSEFAGYRIEEVAGRGGMGIVYRATDLSLERTVALKLISAELGSDAGFRRRFEEESKIAASLDHPNVIPIYGAGEHEGQLYLAMRFVDGDDLGQEIADRGPRWPHRAVDIVIQVASALDAAHARGLVHRDVKPANVMLAPGDHAYLTDFGLSKRLVADSGQTATGNLLGSLDYVTPEQIRGGEVGPATDVYALGCVLFHCLSGKAPFAGVEREAKLWAHVSEPPPATGPGIPEGLDAVIARAMAKDPEERFASAGELADAAEATLGEEPQEVEAAPAATPATVPGPSPSSPLSRREYGRALVLDALRTPFNLAILGGTLIAGLIFGVLVFAAPVAVLLYAAAVVVTCFDRDVQDGVLERERRKRHGAGHDGAAGPPPAVGSGTSWSRIAALLQRADDKQRRIADAIERAELPYEEVSEEVDRLMATIRQIAGGAERLEEGLEDAPPERISTRLRELEAENDPARAGLIEALRIQLAAQQHLEQQLSRFYGRMEEILVEFDTIRGQLVSLSASTDAGNQRRLAARVQDLREEAGSVAEGMATAYGDQASLLESDRE